MEGIETDRVKFSQILSVRILHALAHACKVAAVAGTRLYSMNHDIMENVNFIKKAFF